MTRLLITPSAVFEIDSKVNLNPEKLKTVTETTDRPTFLQNDELQLVAIFVEQDTYNQIIEIIDHYKESKSFGIGDINRVWKLVKPMIEKAFGDT